MYRINQTTFLDVCKHKYQHCKINIVKSVPYRFLALQRKLMDISYILFSRLLIWSSSKSVSLSSLPFSHMNSIIGLHMPCALTHSIPTWLLALVPGTNKQSGPCPPQREHGLPESGLYRFREFEPNKTKEEWLTRGSVTFANNKYLSYCVLGCSHSQSDNSGHKSP